MFVKLIPKYTKGKTNKFKTKIKEMLVMFWRRDFDLEGEPKTFDFEGD